MFGHILPFWVGKTHLMVKNNPFSFLTFPQVDQGSVTSDLLYEGYSSGLGVSFPPNRLTKSAVAKICQVVKNSHFFRTFLLMPKHTTYAYQKIAFLVLITNMKSSEVIRGYLRSSEVI